MCYTTGWKNLKHGDISPSGTYEPHNKKACFCLQGSLEKYFNMKGFHEKSLKMKYALKSTGESL